MRLNLVSTGDEVLRGEILDTNAARAAALLSERGFEVLRRFTCGDSLPEMVSVLRLAMDSADAVICSGGLGPTQDDRTVEAIAAALGLAVVEDAGLLAEIQEKLQSIGAPFTPNQARQARLPAGATAIPNPHGTAVGLLLHLPDVPWLFFLPGPPREFLPMLSEAVLPRLEQARAQGGASGLLVTRILRVFGKGEGWVEETLGPLEREIEGLVLGFQAALPEILIKLRARADSLEAAERILDAAEAKARKRLGDLIYGTGERTLPGVVIDLLNQHRRTLALAESCSGGLLCKLLTDVPGASSVLQGSAVTYSNEWKTRLLGVPKELLAGEGAVSEGCARAMAQGAMRLGGADHALSITGIAGPGGGTLDCPVGTVFIAVASRDAVLCEKRLFPGRDRDWVRLGSAYTALSMLRKRFL